MSNAILTFKSHTAGTNADVTIFEDRIEWVQKKNPWTSPGFWAGILFTAGFWALTLLIPRGQSTEMLPIKRVSSVTTNRKNPFFTDVKVYASGNTVDFTVSNDIAEKVKATLNSLVLAA
jgi:hypothetical protein